MNYINHNEEISDEELISIIRTGDKSAVEILINRYQSTVKKCSRKFFLYGGDENDVLQEGLIGLYLAIKNYDKQNGASFKTFAKLCIERNLITAIKLSNRQKHLLLNNAISINANVDNEENSSAEIMEVLENYESEDPFEILMRKEYFEEFNSKIGATLTTKEKNILDEYKTGKSYAEIAETLNCNVKSVDTALTRIRRKANKIQEMIEND